MRPLRGVCGHQQRVLDVTAALTIKLGGVAADAREALAVVAAHAHPSCVLVHGGGREVDAWSARLGLRPATHEGLRVTDPATLEVVTAVLAGVVNTRLVTMLGTLKRPAVGLTGADAGLLRIDPAAEALGAVGVPRTADATLLEVLLAAGFLPVVASLAADDAGQLRNVNADDVAAAIAAARGGRLLLGTDVAAVMRDGAPIAELSVRDAESMLASGEASAGMRPKLRAALRAAAAGCEVLILDGRSPAAIAEALAGGTPGTRIGAAAAAAPARSAS